jgi:carbamoyl-phosphate synthase/aspartate carbamoyltransferase
VEYLPESPPDSHPHPQVEIVFTDKHILSVQQFSRNLLRQIFRRASQFRLAKVSATPYPKPLANKLIGLCFYTPSTRTRCSYESAIKRLGGDVMYIGAHESSVQKGESFPDTIRTLDSYTDGLIIRTPNDLQLSTYKNISRHSIINAGDMLEHPTQALLDLFTIREIRGTVNNLTYGFVGDCLNGRTIISLAMLLCNYNATIYFIPEPTLGPSPQLLAYLSRFPGNIKVVLLDESSSFKSVISKLDIIYMTRVQKERLIQQQSTQPINHILTQDVLIHAKLDAVILHPLPRNEELPTDIDMDPRAAYFQQMEYGLYLRMALVELLFGKR